MSATLTNDVAPVSSLRTSARHSLTVRGSASTCERSRAKRRQQIGGGCSKGGGEGGGNRGADAEQPWRQETCGDETGAGRRQLESAARGRVCRRGGSPGGTNSRLPGLALRVQTWPGVPRWRAYHVGCLLDDGTQQRRRFRRPHQPAPVASCSCTRRRRVVPARGRISRAGADRLLRQGFPVPVVDEGDPLIPLNQAVSVDVDCCHERPSLVRGQIQLQPAQS